ncbi:hypothetical protein [Dysgonomonas sp. ZJ709]|uniref:hypothetical protein n=1 Tax=Dysgonomonas sp. ZJ709 TaxID=2709797 RepID=UPI0013EC20ED|nr:hypothetical protein [Dysgonomonas sp. ZJ709]
MIHYFNPGHETAVLNSSPYYTHPANIAILQRELGFLPAWYATPGDVVLVEDELNEEFVSYLSENLGFKIEAITRECLKRYNTQDILLWGISPQSINVFEEINKEYHQELKLPVWKESYAYLNSRQAARDCLEELLRQLPQISSSIIPHFYTNLEDIEQVVEASPFQLLAKAPFSSSGRGLLRLPIGGLTRTERQILHGILKKQGTLSIERLLDKEVDFAMEFMSDGKGKVEFAGYSLFATNVKGAYLGNYIDSQENIEKQLADKISLALLDDVKSKLISILSEKYAYEYKGCIGVDMLIYTDENSYALQPCLEINMRYNMGFMVIQLIEKYISLGRKGFFHIDFSSKDGEIYEKHTQMQFDHPTRFKDKKLLSGYLPLCPVNENSHYWAYVLLE